MTLNQTKSVKLSEHFTLYEFVHSEAAERMGINNMPDDIQMQNMIMLCRDILEPTRLAMDEPIRLSSGLRCRRLNQAVGGVKNSQHITGCAADIRIRNQKHLTRLVKVLTSNPKVDQLIIECREKNHVTWLHVSRADNPRHFIGKMTL
jgi:zinc D-Ala-D-Ala carboxypeptidase